MQAMTKGGGDESSMPDLDNHTCAGHEEPPVPGSSLPKDCSVCLLLASLAMKSACRLHAGIMACFMCSTIWKHKGLPCSHARSASGGINSSDCRHCGCRVCGRACRLSTVILLPVELRAAVMEAACRFACFA